VLIRLLRLEDVEYLWKMVSHRLVSGPWRAKS